MEEVSPHVVKNSICQKNHILQKYNIVTFFLLFCDIVIHHVFLRKLYGFVAPLSSVPKKGVSPPSFSRLPAVGLPNTHRYNVHRHKLAPILFFVCEFLCWFYLGKERAIACPKKQMLSKASKHECDRKRKSQQR